MADKYARQLDDLMRALRSTHSHFVRCIKPNHDQAPNKFLNDLVLEQLRDSGMVDAVCRDIAEISPRYRRDIAETQGWSTR